jgi:hypothetical protein
MPKTKVDWADEIIAKKKLRGDTHTTADFLREGVKLACDNNIHSWHSGDTAEVRAKAAKKETKRLIKLRRDEDAREELEHQYQQKNITVEACYNTPGKIASVKLPFNKAEWGDLLNTEGEHLPSCCADISRIRDILQTALRSDGNCDVEELWEATMLAKNHGFAKDGGPVGRMMKLWDEVAKDARTTRSTGGCGDLNNDPKEALEQLYKCAGVIVWNELFDNSGPDQKFSNDANSERALATLVACVRTLFFKMKDLSVGKVSGYGIFNGDEIGESRSGIALYRTKKMADEICEKWNQTETTGKKSKRPPRVYTVHKCQVTMEHGVEKLDG